MSQATTASEAGKNAYMSAREAGMDRTEARRRAQETRIRVRAEVAVDDPVNALVASLKGRLSTCGAERAHLLRDRDGLVEALATALGVSEVTAMQIARLDVDDPREDRQRGDEDETDAA